MSNDTPSNSSAGTDPPMPIERAAEGVSTGPDAGQASMPIQPAMPPPIPEQVTSASPPLPHAREPSVGTTGSSASPPPVPPASPFVSHVGIGAGPTTSAAGRIIDPSVTAAQKQFCMFMHLTLILAGAMAILAIIVPLIMWQMKRDESPFIDDHGRETVNFHITLNLYLLASIPLMFVCGIGIPLAIGAFALGVVGCIMGSIAANKGEYYRYPMCIRLLK